MHQTITVQPSVHVPWLPALLVGHALLQVLDLTTTALALQAGGVEANPVSRMLIEQGWWLFGLVKLAVAASFLALWPMLGHMRPGERQFVTAGMVAFGVFMTAVVINNALIAF